MKSSLSVKFIALITPILLGVFGIFVALHEWHNYANAREDLRLRMNMMAASQSIILAESVANKDIDRLSLQLATVISDPDLVGVVVLDAENRILDEFGDMSDGDADLVTEVPINYSDGDGVRVVGTLCLVMTDRNLLADVRAHMIKNGLLVLALLVAAILTAILTHRRTVLRPLDRLLALSARFSTRTTYWVLPKGRSAAQEVSELPKNRRTMFHVEQSHTDSEAGIIVGRGKWSAKA